MNKQQIYQIVDEVNYEKKAIYLGTKWREIHIVVHCNGTENCIHTVTPDKFENNQQSHQSCWKAHKRKRKYWPKRVWRRENDTENEREKQKQQY